MTPGDDDPSVHRDIFTEIGKLADRFEEETRARRASETRLYDKLDEVKAELADQGEQIATIQGERNVERRLQRRQRLPEEVVTPPIWKTAGMFFAVIAAVIAFLGGIQSAWLTGARMAIAVFHALPKP